MQLYAFTQQGMAPLLDTYILCISQSLNNNNDDDHLQTQGKHTLSFMEMFSVRYYNSLSVTLENNIMT